MVTIEESIAAYNTLLDRLEEVEVQEGLLNLFERRDTIRVDGAELDRIEEQLDRPLPPQYRSLFEHGVAEGDIYSPQDREFDFSYLEVLDPRSLPEMLEWWGVPEDEEDEFDDNPGWRLRFQQAKFGIPLWTTENTVVVDSRDGSVSFIWGEPELSVKLADDLAEFLWHFTACGCLNYGAAEGEHFLAYWELISDKLPVDVAPQDNLWLQFLDEAYSGDIIASWRANRSI